MCSCAYLENEREHFFQLAPAASLGSYYKVSRTSHAKYQMFLHSVAKLEKKTVAAFLEEKQNW